MAPASNKNFARGAKRLFVPLLRFAGGGLAVLCWVALELLLWDISTPFWFLIASVFASGFALTALMGMLSTRHERERAMGEGDDDQKSRRPSDS